MLVRRLLWLIITDVSRVAALILAAGQSRRMGAFKPLLPFGDQSVIESCIHHLRSAGIEDVIVVIGHRADDVRAHLNSAQVLFAVNDDAGSDMSVSIAHGVAAAPEDAAAILVTPVDLPAIPPEAIEKIISEWRRGAQLVQPEYQGRGGHPVLIDAAYRDELLHLDSRRGLRSFFEKHRTETRRLPLDSPYIARDLDTWEDYVNLHFEIFGRPVGAS